MATDQYPLSKRPAEDAFEALPKVVENTTPSTSNSCRLNARPPTSKWIGGTFSLVVNSQFFAAQRLQQALPILKRRWATDFHPSLIPRQRKRLQGRTRSREEWITAIEMIRPHVLNDSQRASLMKEESMSPQSNT